MHSLELCKNFRFGLAGLEELFDLVEMIAEFFHVRQVLVDERFRKARILD
jgi:hypothetical protein